MSSYIDILRKGFLLDINPISKPVVDFGFTIAKCEAHKAFVQIKVTVDGYFIACVFDGSCKQCGVCTLKQWRQNH